MSISRRKFITAGTMIALTAGIPLKAVAFSTTQESGSATGTQPLPQVKADPIFDYTKAIFAAQLNSSFQLQSKRVKPVVVKLTQVNDVGPVPDQRVTGRECFSLVFTTRAKLPQDTYMVEHAALGKFALFIVPVGKGKVDREYEAVINRMN
jgi:hypothetical protein